MQWELKANEIVYFGIIVTSKKNKSTVIITKMHNHRFILRLHNMLTPISFACSTAYLISVCFFVAVLALPSSFDLLTLTPEPTAAVSCISLNPTPLPVMKPNPILNASQCNLSIHKRCLGSFALAVTYAEEVEVLVPRDNKDVGTCENEKIRTRSAMELAGSPRVCIRAHCIWRGGSCWHSERRKGNKVWAVRSGTYGMLAGDG
jgi:hypothetical protein